MADLQQIILKYKGRPLSESEYTGYQRWALGFFPNSDLVLNPDIGMTIQLDISDLEAAFNRIKNMSLTEFSFTAFLTYLFFKSITKHKELNFRYLDGRWYELTSVPLFIPINVPEPDRFRQILMEDVQQMSLGDFVSDYTRQVENVADSNWKESEISPYTYEVSVFIGNLPTLQFTSLTPNQRAVNMGKPFLYFGKRYRMANKLFMPLHMSGHHSTFDPVVFDSVLRTVFDLSGDRGLIRE